MPNMQDEFLQRNDEGVIELSIDEWSRIYSTRRVKSEEKVVAIGKLDGDGAVVLPKIQWSRGFKGLSGLVLTGGKANELIPGGDQGRRILLGAKTVAALGVCEKDALCVTETNNRYFIKSLICRELRSRMPGWVVLDAFEPTRVVRWWASNPDVTGISDRLLEQMLEAVGQLRYDPMPAVIEMTDDALLPAKREFLGTVPIKDCRRLSAYVEDVRLNQLANGSWGDSVVATAGNIIRLLQAGVLPADQTVQRGVSWLEQSLEPVGMPGLFTYAEVKGAEYNRRMAAKKPPLDIPSEKQRAYFDRISEDYFSPYLDLVPKAHKACEPHTTWPTALALDALLRCGQIENHRVVRAIRTLIQYRCQFSDCGGWCGCGIFGSTLEARGTALNGPVDFDSVKTPRSNRDIEFATWFMNKAAARSMVCNPSAENCTSLKLRSNMGLLVKNRLSSPISNCTTVIEGALARHPLYHGSKLEELAAYDMSGMQNPNGDWPSHRISGMLHYLSLVDHPLARFLAYRSLPGLIEKQNRNGLWFSDKSTQSVDDLLILTALKRMGILERLMAHPVL